VEKKLKPNGRAESEKGYVLSSNAKKEGASNKRRERTTWRRIDAVVDEEGESSSLIRQQELSVGKEPGGL